MRALDLDVRRLEARANALMARLDLADDGTVRMAERWFVVTTSETTARFPIEDDGRLTPATWAQVRCFLHQQSRHGCPEAHVHWSSQEEGAQMALDYAALMNAQLSRFALAPGDLAAHGVSGQPGLVELHDLQERTRCHAAPVLAALATLPGSATWDDIWHVIVPYLVDE
jgi:hypothetical protein